MNGEKLPQDGSDDAVSPYLIGFGYQDRNGQETAEYRRDVAEEELTVQTSLVDKLREAVKPTFELGLPKDSNRHT